MHFLRLTDINGKDVRIDPQKVCFARELDPDENGEPLTFISFGDSYVIVKGDIENTTDLIVAVALLK